MKLNNLFEGFDRRALSEDQKTWVKMCLDAGSYKTDEDFYTIDGKIETTRTFLYVAQFEQDYDQLPEYIRFKYVQNFIIGKDSTITNFDIMPEESARVRFEDGAGVPASLKGLSKNLKVCVEIELNRQVETGLLELFKIKHMAKVKYNGNKNSHKMCNIELAIDIINKHLKTGDVFDCQEELHNAGLQDFC